MCNKLRKMGKTNKDLLQFEHRDSSSNIESALLVCGKQNHKEQEKSFPKGKPLTSPVPTSNVLGRVKDFLGVFAEANQSLQNNAKDNPEEYDIECLKGGESEYIEMDLMLGVADLQTPEAVAAAEAAMEGNKTSIDLPCESSTSSSDDSSEDEDDNDLVDNGSSKDECPSEKPTVESDKACSRDRTAKLRKNKKPKIMELP